MPFAHQISMSTAIQASHELCAIPDLQTLARCICKAKYDALLE